MRLRRLPTALVFVWLALGAAEAHADHFDFTVSPDPPNQGEVTTFTLQGPTGDIERVRWDLDGDGEFDATEEDELTVTHVYGAPGPVTVSMRVDEEDGGQPHRASQTITINGAPTVDFDFTPTSPVTGQEVSFTPTAADPEDDELELSWSFGDGATSTAASPAHSYTADGTYTVTLTATDEHGATAFSSQAITVLESPGPTAGFTYSPDAPFTGDLVTFISSSTPGQGSLTGLDWDLDGDGDFDDATGAEVSWTYTSAGTRLVRLRATQTDGKESVASADVDVAERPPDPPPPDPPPPDPPPPDPPPPDTGTPSITDPVGGVGTTTPPPAPTRLVRMRPFPLVRIAGVVLPTGADVRILSVRASRRARVRVRCRGRGCPVRSLTRARASRLVRLRRFERTLRAGTRLELFVTQPGRIGKYTRFLIRAGKAPARVDRCLIPGRARPVRCS